MPGLRLGRHCWIVLFAIASCLADGRASLAQGCSEWLGTALASALQPVLDETNPCADLRKEVDLGLFKVTVGLNRKELFRLRGLTYCPTQTTSRVMAVMDLRCRTGPNADVPASVSETFDLDMTARNADCSITAFQVQPRGEIGKLMAGLTDLSDRVRRAAEPHLLRLCRGP